jgi:hypothetical protein
MCQVVDAAFIYALLQCLSRPVALNTTNTGDWPGVYRAGSSSLVRLRRSRPDYYVLAELSLVTALELDGLSKRRKAGRESP